MNSRSIALVAIFASVALIFNTIRIPAIMWPGLTYPVWEIPIIIACLLFGFKIAIAIAIINLIGELALFQLGPGSIAGYPMGFIALLVTLLGIYVAKKINRYIIRKGAPEKTVDSRRMAVLLTGFSTAFRVGIMPFSDYLVFYGILLPLVGVPIPDTYRAALIPYFILFNLMVPLYTLPISYFIAIKASNIMKIDLALNK